MRRVFRWGQYMWECEAGQADRPVGCEHHDEHHWCSTCRGWYDVPHDGIHDGPPRHPNAARQAAQGFGGSRLMKGEKKWLLLTYHKRFILTHQNWISFGLGSSLELLAH